MIIKRNCGCSDEAAGRQGSEMEDDTPLNRETVWQVYELEKKIIRDTAKSTDEYDARIQRLLAELGI